MAEEKRIALLPTDVAAIPSRGQLIFERGYGLDCHIPDSAYRAAGARIGSTATVYDQPIVCQPKYVDIDARRLKQGQTVFGWLHLQEKTYLADQFVRRNATAIAWEWMMHNGKNVFQRNSELTGEIGVEHALQCSGIAYDKFGDLNTAVIGRGPVGKGAMRALREFGIEHIAVYHSQNARELKKHIGTFDIVVHAACSPTEILSRKDMARLSPGALFVHLGADCIGGDFRARPLGNPLNTINGGKNDVYCANHVPTIRHEIASRAISKDVHKYVNMLSRGEAHPVLDGAIVIDRGQINRDRMIEAD